MHNDNEIYNTIQNLKAMVAIPNGIIKLRLACGIPWIKHDPPSIDIERLTSSLDGSLHSEIRFRQKVEFNEYFRLREADIITFGVHIEYLCYKNIGTLVYTSGFTRVEIVNLSNA